MKRNVSVVRLIVATRSSGPPASSKIIKEMPGSVASGTLYITYVLVKALNRMLMKRNKQISLSCLQFRGTLYYSKFVKVVIFLNKMFFTCSFYVGIVKGYKADNAQAQKSILGPKIIS